MIQDIKLHLLENNTGQVPGVKENPRDLTGDGFAKAKQSIKDFPEMLEVRTLVAVKHGDRFVVIGGNQRLRAMRDLDHDTAPVMVVDWPVDKINEFIIKDNVEYGVWNFDLLANEWDAELLVEWGMNLPVDFGDVDDSLIGGQSDVDDVPEAPEVPKSKLGDIWICGKHRVMCGDSTSIDAVERLMDGQKADMVFTDPPYGISIVKGNKVGGDKVVKANTYAPIAGDDTIEVAIEAIQVIKTLNAKVEIIWGGNYYANALENSSCWIVWDKDNTGNFADAELAWTNQKTAVRIFKHTWNGMIKASEHGQKRVHPTQKPVKLAEWCFDEYGEKCETVLDLFCGSGSTLIACEAKKKTGYMMELSPHYCDVIIKRWQDFTGKDAILESTQQKFNEL